MIEEFYSVEYLIDSCPSQDALWIFFPIALSLTQLPTLLVSPPIYGHTIFLSMYPMPLHSKLPRQILTHTSHCPSPPHYPLLYTEDGFLLEIYPGYQHLLFTPHSCCLWLFWRHRNNNKAFMSCFVCPTLTPSEIIFQPFLTIRHWVAWFPVERVLKRLQHTAAPLQEPPGPAYPALSTLRSDALLSFSAPARVCLPSVVHTCRTVVA